MDNHFFDSKDQEPLEREIQKNKIQEGSKDLNIENLLYDKEIICPVCSKAFSYRVVKSHAPKVKSKDSDSFIRYKDIVPYFYEIIVCPNCGYSAFRNEFEKIKSNQREIIYEKVGTHWRHKEFPKIYDESIAIERYKLALLSAVIGDFKISTKSILSLKIAWMYRLLERKKEEEEYLKKAIQGLTSAYESESTPIYGLNINELQFLIGELNRRIGNFNEANQWFGRVITESDDYRLKEKTRNMRELMK